MKKIAVCILTIINFLVLNAQNNTIGDEGTPSLTDKSSVLVIPFESKMYLSDIDRNLAATNEMNFQEIKARFRAALDREIFIALKGYYNPMSFYSIEPKESVKELAYIYNSIGYKYEVVPEEVVVKKENVGKKLIGKLKALNEKRGGKSKRGSEDEYIKAGVHNGEIVSQVDNREKYMKTTLANEELLSNLNKKYSASHYVFINELDIKQGASDMYEAAEDQYKREIKVHYTIFTNEGKEVSSGAIKSRFPSGQNDVDKIIKLQFPLIAERIVSNLIGPDKAVVD